MTADVSFPIHIFKTRESACDYFSDGRLSTFFVAKSDRFSQELLYSDLATNGYRRQGDLLYTPHCNDCQCCIPSRVRVDEFKPDRTLSKIWNRNQDLSIRTVRYEEALSDESYNLYLKYEKLRHPGSLMATYSKEQLYKTVFLSKVETFALEYRLEGRLVLTAIIDLLAVGVSAVYTYFDPALARRSLGTFSILKEIEITRSAGRGRHLYLGLWLSDFPGMEYKSRFTPFEVLWDGKWQLLSNCQNAIREHSIRVKAQHSTSENASD